MKYFNKHAWNRIITAFFAAILMNGLSAAPVYYTFEGDIVSITNYGGIDINYSVGDHIKYVLLVDFDQQGTRTWNDGTIEVFDDTYNEYDLYTLTRDLFYADLIGEGLLESTNTLPAEENHGTLYTTDYYGSGMNQSLGLSTDGAGNLLDMDSPTIYNEYLTLEELMSVDREDIYTAYESARALNGAMLAVITTKLTIAAISDTPPEPSWDVQIDVQPKSTTNYVRLNTNKLLPVAIMGSSSYDVTQVDSDTVTFEGASPALPVKVKDIDGDGNVDMLFKFAIPETSIECGDTEATLIGQTFLGQDVTGSDSIITKGCK